MLKLSSSCPLDCFDSCRFAVEIEDNKILNIKADPNHKVTAGFVCAKGRAHLARLTSAARLTEPLIRKDDELQPLSMDNALNYLAENLTRVTNSYGSTAIMNYTGSGSSGVLHDLSTRFFNALGGVTEPKGSICWGSGLAAQKLDFGTLKSHSWDDLANAKLIVLWGRDPHTTNLHLWPYIKRACAQGCRLLVINPLLITASSHADMVLRPRPGTDGILALALGREIVNSGLQDNDFITQKTSGFTDYYNLVQKYDLAMAAEITGIPASAIKAAADLYATCQPASIIFGYGMQRYANSGHSIRYIDALAALTGNLGVAGGGANYAHQVWDEDLNDITGPELASHQRILPMPTLASAIVAAQEPELQIINISRANPVTQHPDSWAMAAALKQTPLVVVTDMFKTDTAAVADLVLPCTSFLEETNLLKSSWHHYMHYYSALASAPGQCLPDYEIYQRLAAMMGVPGFSYQEPDEWISWIIKPLTDRYGLTLEELKKGPWMHPKAHEIPWQEQIFATDDGKYHFVQGEVVKTEQEPDSHYPWRLMTPHRRDRMHSQGFEEDQEIPVIQLNNSDADKIGIEDGQLVKIVTPTGQLSGRAKLDKRVLSGIVVIAQGSWLLQGGGVNQLTSEVDPDLGGGTPLYDNCCRIELAN